MVYIKTIDVFDFIEVTCLIVWIEGSWSHEQIIPLLVLKCSPTLHAMFMLHLSLLLFHMKGLIQLHGLQLFELVGLLFELLGVFVTSLTKVLVIALLVGTKVVLRQNNRILRDQARGHLRL